MIPPPLNGTKDAASERARIAGHLFDWFTGKCACGKSLVDIASVRAGGREP